MLVNVTVSKQIHVQVVQVLVQVKILLSKVLYCTQAMYVDKCTIVLVFPILVKVGSTLHGDLGHALKVGPGVIW